jgi:hypothetical protein
MKGLNLLQVRNEFKPKMKNKNTKFEIRKVLGRVDGVKLITIPKNADIFPGDYVLVQKVEGDFYFKNKEVPQTA